MNRNQHDLEQFVRYYFEHRKDTRVVLEESGVLRIFLDSPTSKQHFGDFESIVLVFDPDRMEGYDQVEMMTRSHHFLDVIRNDLFSGIDPRYTTVHGVLNTRSFNGEIEIPNVKLLPNNGSVEVQFSYKPIAIVAWQVYFVGYEPSQQIIRIALDVWAGKDLTSVMERIDDFPALDGLPSGDYKMPEGIKLIDDTESIIHSMVMPSIVQSSQKTEKILKIEIKDLKDHFTRERNEIDKRDRAGRDHAGRQRIDDLERKYEKELMQKYETKVALKPLSIKLVWMPVAKYSAVIKGNNKALRFNGIALYDPCYGGLLHKGKQGDAFAACIPGKHGVWVSQETRFEQCIICGEFACPKHDHICEQCGNHVCSNDSSSCSYGNHPQQVVFCSKCHCLSYENLPICIYCKNVCEQCGRYFPDKLVSKCKHCDKIICINHSADPCGVLCAQCHSAVCTDHMVQTDDGEIVCLDHAKEASCCQRIFRESKLLHCVANQEELLCPDHRVNCAVCGEAVCESHRFFSIANKEYLCPAHAGHCIHCKDGENVYRNELLKRCVDDNGLACENHRDICPSCQEKWISLPAFLSLPRCVGCSNVSCGHGNCSHQARICPRCGESYCINCFEDETCHMCSNLRKVDSLIVSNKGQIPNEHLQLLKLIGEEDIDNVRTITNKIIKYQKYLQLEKGENSQRKIKEYYLKGGLIWNMFHRNLCNFRVRILQDLKGNILRSQVLDISQKEKTA